jgi:hypothetical protein
LYTSEGRYTYKTLDFCFVRKEGANVADRPYIVEMKTWIDFEGGRHARLSRDEAQKWARKIWNEEGWSAGKVRIQGHGEINPRGVVLVWPSADPIEPEAPLVDVVTLECILRELNDADEASYRELLCQLEKACTTLFQGIREFRKESS